jgi:FixJ family two-component response regulator
VLDPRCDPFVYIVDDDDSVRTALTRLLRSADLAVDAFGSAEEFLSQVTDSAVGCLLLDLQLPGMGGLELQEHLAAARSPLAIIFITAHGDEATRKRAMTVGATAFFRKPLDGEVLLDAIRATVE